MSIKEFFGKLKDNAAKAAKVTARYNADFYGNVDYGVKDTDFAVGTYVNMEKGHGLIYGSNIEDYTFTANDIATYEWVENAAPIRKGGDVHPAERCRITFKDGKKAQMDILVSRVEKFKKVFGLEK